MLKRIDCNKHSRLLGPFEEIEVIEVMWTWRQVPSKLTIWLKKLECYITLGWKGLSVTNTIEYWDIFEEIEVMRIRTQVPYSPYFMFFVIYKWGQ